MLLNFCYVTQMSTCWSCYYIYSLTHETEEDKAHNNNNHIRQKKLIKILHCYSSSCLDFLDDFCVLCRQVNMLLLISSRLLRFGCNKLSIALKKSSNPLPMTTYIMWTKQQHHHLFPSQSRTLRCHFDFGAMSFIICMFFFGSFSQKSGKSEGKRMREKNRKEESVWIKYVY